MGVTLPDDSTWGLRILYACRAISTRGWPAESITVAPGAGGVFLRRADLDHEVAARFKVFGRLDDKAVKNGEPSLAAVEGHMRLIMAHTDRQLRHVFGGNVGWIADHNIKGPARDRVEQIALHELDAVRQAVLVGVATSDRNRLFTDVDGGDLGLGKVHGERDGNGARAGADVHDSWNCHLLRQSQRLHDRCFGVRPGDQYGRRDSEFQSIEFFTADKVCDRTAFEPPADQLAISLANFRRRELSVAQAVQVNAFAAGDVGQQHLSIQARRLHALVREVLCGPVEQGAEGPGLFGHFLTFGMRLTLFQVPAKPLFLVEIPQRLHDLVEVADDDLVELVDGKTDAVIGDAVLREIVGTDALAALA
jgi:hypothetical protein